MSEITPSAMRQECLDNESIEADDIRVRDPLVPSVGVFDSDSFSEFIIINVPSVWGGYSKAVSLSDRFCSGIGIAFRVQFRHSQDTHRSGMYIWVKTTQHEHESTQQ
ncbi:hypothetical protein FGSG_12698 [Fusarium graminearum PH-1]|uniref:hypothetical protein n=1 Tax=Gibberella zeae (strain ATCC MYA-4620 / CBS 123657 / FGSC 9075 / NRRL 31084 / PH-1) TaxID=229533 RepID=UPI00021F15F7|nr:hypothetical protein FGSG_12698 [Fusarium graminearum PH-1]ESU11115.1 hypothetical protein FGSG_12698 [Fusarium graminearum PH-1]|eukprot:XP_011323691.1 hypothetical protein FGSG_12698 [Fusarium graminearum PH-1]